MIPPATSLKFGSIYKPNPCVNRFGSLSPEETCELSTFSSSIPLQARNIRSISETRRHNTSLPISWTQFKLDYYKTFLDWPLEGSPTTDSKLTQMLSHYLQTVDVESAQLLQSDTCKEILIAALALSNSSPAYTCIDLKLHTHLNKKDLKIILESAIDGDCENFLKIIIHDSASNRQDYKNLLESLLIYTLQQFKPQCLSVLLEFKNLQTIQIHPYHLQPLNISFLLHSLLHYRSQKISEIQKDNFIACIEVILHFHLASPETAAPNRSLFTDLLINPSLDKKYKYPLLALFLDKGLLSVIDCEASPHLIAILKVLEQRKKKIYSTKRAQS